jgi:hypothetical protein
MAMNFRDRRTRLASALALLALLAAPTGAQAAAGTTPTTAAGSNAGGAPAPGTAAGTPAGTPTAPAASTPATTAATVTSAPAATPPVTTTSALAIHPAAKASNTISHGALAAAILAGLIALACLVWGIFRLGAFEPQWLLSLRHSLAEAGFRASATWAEFSDWIRLGH